LAPRWQLVYLQGTRPAPALPATFSLFVTLLGGLTALVLIYRVLINVRDPTTWSAVTAGGFVGLMASFAIRLRRLPLAEAGGGFAPQDAPKDIPTVHPDAAGAGLLPRIPSDARSRTGLHVARLRAWS